MAERLNIDDDLKIGKEEILLDPNVTGKKCGKEVTALTLNDLMYVKENSQVVCAIDYIQQLIANNNGGNNGNGGGSNSNTTDPLTVIYQ